MCKGTAKFTNPSLYIPCFSCPCLCFCCHAFTCCVMPELLILCICIFTYLVLQFNFFFFICLYFLFYIRFFFFILKYLFINFFLFISFFVVIICCLDLLWNFSVMELVFSNWIFLLGFLFFDLYTWISGLPQ